ncbi:MAG: hypothetical protein Q8J68_05535 [Methanolobus sp.]|uniref:hypothetical protein n=1 Tax=Methanolobus sp. TaxID=1874737 RepID=UPI00273042CF|nr:hypothetical protein [Methanolobus sp.]MDP2216732.1 hypothetical protein [Methanolobus sp.]
MPEYVGAPLEIAGRGDPEPNQQIVRTQPGHHNVHAGLAEQLSWEAIGNNTVYSRTLGRFTLQTEVVEPAYGSDIEVDSGFLTSNHSIDAGTKTIHLALSALTTYTRVDATYQSKSFIFDEVGFYKMTFNININLHASHFILELIDDQGVVRWSRNGSALVTDQVVNIISTSWKFRVRCTASVNTDALFNNWATISNIRMERFKSEGYIVQNWWHHYDNMNTIDRVQINHITGVEGASLKARLMFSDDLDAISPWLGPSTPADFYTGHGGLIFAGGYTPKYWRARVYFYSDGRYSPVLTGLTYTMYLDNPTRILEHPANTPHPVGVPVFFRPLTWLRADHEENENLPWSGRSFTKRLDFLRISRATTMTVPVAFRPLTWLRADHIENNTLPISYREFWAALFRITKSWSESAVGVVMSGYARDQNGQLIKGAYKIILESSNVPDRDLMGQVNPENGVFQLFIQEAMYDRRWLLVEYQGKAANIALAGYGTPKVLDGTKGPVSNQDLHFWKAPICTTVAHVDSLVTY